METANRVSPLFPASIRLPRDAETKPLEDSIQPCSNTLGGSPQTLQFFSPKPKKRKKDIFDPNNHEMKALERFERQRAVWNSIGESLIRRTGTRQDGTTNFLTATAQTRAHAEDFSLVQCAVPQSDLTNYYSWESLLRCSDPTKAVRYVQIGKAYYPYALFGEIQDSSSLKPNNPAYMRMVMPGHESLKSGEERAAARAALREHLKVTKDEEALEEAEKVEAERQRHTDDYYRAQLFKFSQHIQKKFSHFLLPRSFMQAEGSSAVPQMTPEEYDNVLEAERDHPPSPVRFYPPPQTVKCLLNESLTGRGAQGSPCGSIVGTPTQLAASGKFNASQEAADASGDFPKPFVPALTLSTKRLLFRGQEGELVHGHIRVTNTSSVAVYYSWLSVDLIEEGLEHEEQQQQMNAAADCSPSNRGYRSPNRYGRGSLSGKIPLSVTALSRASGTHKSPSISSARRSSGTNAQLGGGGGGLTGPESPPANSSVGNSQNRIDPGLSILPPPSAPANHYPRSPFAGVDNEMFHWSKKLHQMASRSRKAKSFFRLSSPMNGVLLPDESTFFPFSLRATHQGSFHRTFELLTIPPSPERIFIELRGLVDSSQPSAASLSQVVEETLQSRSVTDVQRHLVRSLTVQHTPFDASNIRMAMKELESKKQEKVDAVVAKREKQKKAWERANRFSFDALPYHPVIYDKLEDLFNNLDACMSQLDTPLKHHHWDGSINFLRVDISRLRDAASRVVLEEGLEVLLRAARASYLIAPDQVIDTAYKRMEGESELTHLLRLAAGEVTLAYRRRAERCIQEEQHFVQLPREPLPPPTQGKPKRAASAAGGGASSTASGGGKKHSPGGKEGAGTGVVLPSTVTAPFRAAAAEQSVEEAEALDLEYGVLLSDHLDQLEDRVGEMQQRVLDHFLHVVELACSQPLLNVVQGSRVEDVYAIQHIDEMTVDTGTDALVTQRPSVKGKQR